MARLKKNNTLQKNKENKEVSMTQSVETEVQEIQVLKIDIETAREELAEIELDNKRKELEMLQEQIRLSKEELNKVSTPRRKLDADEVRIMEKYETVNIQSDTLKAKIAAQKEYDSVMVTGKFINRHRPGKVDEKLTYMKYETDPVKWYHFDDGKVYTIPRGFVDQIKNHYYTPHFIQKNGIMDGNNPESQIESVDTSNKKYDFVPVNF